MQNLFRFPDLKPFGPKCGSSVCVKSYADKFDDMKFKTSLPCKKFVDEESYDDSSLEEAEQEEVTDDTECDLGGDIFGYIEKRKEKERLKLVIKYLIFF